MFKPLLQPKRRENFKRIFVLLSLAGLSACAPFNTLLPVTQPVTVKNAQNLMTLSNLNTSQANELRQKYKQCLSSEDALIAGLDSPQVTSCSFSVQLNKPASEEHTPWTEDNLRHDRTYLTERSIQLSYQGAKGPETIQTYTQLKEKFGPVDTAAKALSFVLLKTPFSQILNQTTINDFLANPDNRSQYVEEILRPDIDGTQVETLPDGSYRVKNLLLNSSCPGPVAKAVSYRISRSGEIQTDGETPIYRLTKCPVE